MNFCIASPEQRDQGLLLYIERLLVTHRLKSLQSQDAIEVLNEVVVMTTHLEVVIYPKNV